MQEQFDSEEGFDGCGFFRNEEETEETTTEGWAGSLTILCHRTCYVCSRWLRKRHRNRDTEIGTYAQTTPNPMNTGDKISNDAKWQSRPISSFWFKRSYCSLWFHGAILQPLPCDQGQARKNCIDVWCMIKKPWWSVYVRYGSVISCQQQFRAYYMGFLCHEGDWCPRTSSGCPASPEQIVVEDSVGHIFWVCIHRFFRTHSASLAGPAPEAIVVIIYQDWDKSAIIYS